MKLLLKSDELIVHMQSKGITFNNISTDDAKEFLERNNYYLKLASYRSNYQKRIKGNGEEQYVNLDFAFLKELSTIDMHLRYIVLEMALDIEHFLKVRLLREIENNPKEDGYHIIQCFIATCEYPPVGRRKKNVLGKIISHKSSDYCKELIEKYFPYFPAWGFVELIDFGTLAFLCEFYSKMYGTGIGDRILLNSVRDIRNAAAHSNCLINNLRPGNNKPHSSVEARVKNSVISIGEDARKKKMRNKCIYDLTCLLFAYDEIITSSVAKQKRYSELRRFIDGRLVRHRDWFAGNNIITSSYRFVREVFDVIST